MYYFSMVSINEIIVIVATAQQQIATALFTLFNRKPELMYGRPIKESLQLIAHYLLLWYKTKGHSY